MMSKLKKQKQNIDALLQLIKENPDLEIVPMVKYDNCATGEWGWWEGLWGKIQIEEYLHYDGWVYIKSEDKDELIEQIQEKKDYTLTTEEAEKIIDGYKWIKCICVKVELPQD